MKLTKYDIIETIQSQTGFTKMKSKEIVEILLETIKHTLEAGDDVLISGFGKFRVCQKQIRKGRNPATGEVMMLSSRKVVRFRCSGELRKKINS